MNIERMHQWNDEAAHGLRDVLGNDADDIANGVDSGRLELWRLNAGRIYLVTCCEPTELVCCCVQGEEIQFLADVVYDIAQRNGLQYVRFFSKRPGLQRLLKRFPVELMGYVYRCPIEPRHVTQ